MTNLKGMYCMNWGHCKECNKELTFKTIYRVRDLDFSRIGFYCNDCGERKEEKVKAERFVEEYKENKIYCKDGKYSPYWQAGYYFLTVEDARARIDNSNVGVYPAEFFHIK